MSFREQMQEDLAVLFNTEEFAIPATLRTISGEEYDVKIIRNGQSDNLTIDPGQADSDTFEVCRSIATDEFEISPNDQITLEDETVWIVQVGVRHGHVPGTWTAPVASDGRVKS